MSEKKEMTIESDLGEIKSESCEGRKHHCGCCKEKEYDEPSFIDQIKGCLYPNQQCPEGACPKTTELVLNPSFEEDCTDPACDVFAFWTGTNIAKSSQALTGAVAAELGAGTAGTARLEQTICGINEGCPYDFSFSVNAQNNANGQFQAQVFWLDSFTPVQAIEPVIINGSSSGNSYVFIDRITSRAPVGTECARIVFTQTGNGSVLIDDVSFSG